MDRAAGTDVIESAIYSKLSDNLKRYWNDVPDYVWGKSEDELLMALPKGQDFTTMAILRIRFWDLMVEKDVSSEAEVSARRLIIGICTKETLRRLLFLHKEFFPWMVIPLKDHKLLRKSLLETAQQRMQEILAASAVQQDGVVDTRLAKIQFALYEALENRVHGAVAQKLDVNQKNLNVNVGAPALASGDQGISELTEMEEVERRLSEVRAKKKALRNVSPIQVNQEKLMKGD